MSHAYLPRHRPHERHVHGRRSTSRSSRRTGARWPIRGPPASTPMTIPSGRCCAPRIDEAAALDDRTARPGKVGEAERLITTRHAEAVDAFIAEHGLDRSGIGIVGFHGQTVLHRPEKRLTIQIGAGAALAAALRLPVAWDMRAADVAAGGQGAPLVPAWHRALVEAARLQGPVAGDQSGRRGERHLRARRRRRSDRLRHRPGERADRRSHAGTHGRSDGPGRGGGRRGVGGRGCAEQPSGASLSSRRRAPKSLDRNAFSREAVAGLSTAGRSGDAHRLHSPIGRARREAPAGGAAPR